GAPPQADGDRPRDPARHGLHRRHPAPADADVSPRALRLADGRRQPGPDQPLGALAPDLPGDPGCGVRAAYLLSEGIGERRGTPVRALSHPGAARRPAGRAQSAALGVPAYAPAPGIGDTHSSGRGARAPDDRTDITPNDGVEPSQSRASSPRWSASSAWS